ncbi:MAG: hypothetical protein ACI8TP_001508 [Acidimicrobiales bacterium]|jgi:hypothetical protein
MFSFRQSRFGGGEDPWFRLGTFDVGSAGIVSLIVVVSMFVYAVEGPPYSLSNGLTLIPSSVTGGQFWRIFTWFVPNAPSIWAILSAVMIYVFGLQLEGALGRTKMAKYLAVMVLIPSALAMVLHVIGIGEIGLGGARLISSALFFTFVAYLPTAKFYFGIPGWVFAAVFFALDVLNAISVRNAAEFVFVVARVALVLLAAKAFGLANDVPWIPDLRGGSGVAAPQRASRRSRFSKGPDLSIVPQDNFDQMGIDAILDQVSAHGVDSLSADQKKQLKAYSKQRKKRG